MNRRSFSKTLAASTLFGFSALQTSTSGARILGANERIRCGFVGIANRGGQLMAAFRQFADKAEIAGLCDVDSAVLGKVYEACEKRPLAVSDYRKLLDQTEIDALVIATPDHWHAIQTVDACKAGKDVYVEKPMSVTVVEGRKMVEAARRYSRIVQVGIQRRSAKHFIELAKLGGDALVGFVSRARCFRLSNMTPDGIGRCQPTAPPATLDWNQWLGPRPERPYQANITPYKFRWWDLYSSQIGNWGAHYLDGIRWFLGEEAPTSVCAMGGRFVVKDDRTIPDTMEALFQFASGRLISYSQCEANSNAMMPLDANGRPLGDWELRGTDGTLYVSDAQAVRITEHGGQFGASGKRLDPKTWPGAPFTESVHRHVENFLECIRTRELPNCDAEIGHRTTSMCLLANISLAVGQRLEWDAAAERFTNCEAANALLHYEYRKPFVLSVE